MLVVPRSTQAEDPQIWYDPVCHWRNATPDAVDMDFWDMFATPNTQWPIEPRNPNGNLCESPVAAVYDRRIIAESKRFGGHRPPLQYGQRLLQRFPIWSSLHAASSKRSETKVVGLSRIEPDRMGSSRHQPAQVGFNRIRSDFGLSSVPIATQTRWERASGKETADR